MMRHILFVLMACFIFFGCSFERIRPIDRNIKPYSAYWIKEGMTKDGRLKDWVKCGGSDNGKYGYEIQSNQSSEDFFDNLHAHVMQLNACMRNHGYIYLEEYDARYLHP